MTVATVRVSSVDLTPQDSLPLFGYGARTGCFEGVRGRIEANVVEFNGVDGRYFLVAVDFLYGGLLGRQLASRLGVEEQNVIVCGSHTHFAPGVDPGLGRLGPTVDEYLEWSVDRIAESVESPPQGGHEVTVSFGSLSTVDLFMNRRRPILGGRIRWPKVGGVVLAPNPEGSVDPNIRVIALRRQDRLLAIIWGVGCHPVCSPQPSWLSPCFPGVVRDQIRQEYGDSLPVLFLQGFSGDVRPASTTRRGSGRSVPGLLRHFLAGGWSFAPQSEAQYQAWCGRLARDVLEATAAACSENGESLEPRAVAFRTQPRGWERSLEMNLLRVSAGNCIMTVNAEVMSERTSDLKAIPGNVVPAGCSGEVFGYWPTGKMVAEGGYEGCSSRRWFPTLDWETVGGPDVLWRHSLKELLRKDRGTD